MTFTRTLQAKPSKLELPWGNPPKPNLWSCTLKSAPKDAPVSGGALYYEIKSPVLNVKNGYQSLIMKFAWTGVQPVVVDVYCTGNGVNLVSMLKIPQYFTLEEALVRVWKRITYIRENQEVFFNTKVASKKKTKTKKRKPNPKSIDRYVKEYAEQKGYESAEDIPSNEKGKAFAIAWSRYCSKRPGSPRCKKDKGTYFSNRPNIAKGIAKSMEEKRRKRTKKKASALSVANRHIKAASGSPATLRDLFSPSSHKSIKLNWGKPAKPNMWKTTLTRNDKRVSGEVVEYTVESPVLMDQLVLKFELKIRYTMDNVRNETVKIKVFWRNTFTSAPLFIMENIPSAEFNAMMTHVWEGLMAEGGKPFSIKIFKPNAKFASQSPYTLRDLFDQRPEAFELAWGTPAKKNMWKVEKEESTRNETYYRIKSPVLNLDLSIIFAHYGGDDRHIKINLITNLNQIGRTLDSYTIKDKDPRLDHPLDTFMGGVWRRMVKKIHARGTPVLKPNIKVASAGGRYGYTKKVQKDCELAVSQLKKYCRSLCSKQKSKGDKHLEFYRAHAEKSGSPFVKAFVQCHKDIYNDALSKVASSMYGYDEKTVKRSLSNINDLQIRSAMLINNLLARKTSDTDKIKAYLSEHIEQVGCVWSTCLYSCL